MIPKPSLPSASLILFALLLLTNVVRATDDDSETDGLEGAWSIKGRWSGVAADHDSGTVYALGADDKCLEIDVEGKTKSELVLQGAGNSVLRFAAWRGKTHPALLTFRTWAKELRVYDLKGKELWTYPIGMGIDDVCPVDLSPDVTGVAVSFNGGGGLHLLDAKGTLVWKTDKIGNVWHVSAGDVFGDGTTQIVSTSAVGQVHIFSGDGKKREDREAGLYANMVRVGKLSEKDESARIIVAGAGLALKARGSTFVAALSGKGEKLWALEIPAGGQNHVASAVLARDLPWLAVTTLGGQVHVIDASTGEFVARVKSQRPGPEVAWLVRRAPQLPLLVVAAGEQLSAYRFIEAER